MILLVLAWPIEENPVAINTEASGSQTDIGNKS